MPAKISANYKKVMAFIEYGFNNTTFTLANIAMFVSLFINFHKLRCPVIHNHHDYSILVFVKGLNTLINNFML